MIVYSHGITDIFPADVFDRVEEDITKQYRSVKCTCPGGGRILHDPDTKKISVFGYSQVGFKITVR